MSSDRSFLIILLWDEQSNQLLGLKHRKKKSPTFLRDTLSKAV